ncbi:TIGR01777 family oxidoreductase [Aquibacillus koreensis]|uniref:TIGR01777 family oxidoreductase n=1 Tax=Aquibacillus koreensis TaxID=279446 RepID=A0A9X3WQU1_9BACI|nr:TIGR01777 family oxidoreductase [Aquibacillus koreensis]MCT2536903.1 TIGR01777 family oxidoreductase [Aquibacillus koreensis]MDC3421966.1 TIGR01777 family oxidoreductase [Aquibacillus koreensis]
MKKHVVIAGGTGFIGSYLQHKFQEQGYKVSIISRQTPHISWKDQASIVQALEGAELLINLAGKSVNCRYNEKNKKAIMDSRTETTTILGNAILSCENPPKIWMNSSTATIYRHAEDRPMTEEGGELGEGFSVDVAKAWEETLLSFDLPNTRQIALRIAIVLGKGGGVMTPYKNLVRFGMGGVQGSGKQKFSWIHVEDLLQIILFLRDRHDLTGIFNVSAPNPVSNKELMTTIRRAMGVSFGLPAPRLMLEMGAIFIRTETELVLKSRWVIPERLEREGFQFSFPTLEKTIKDIIK